MLAARVDLDLSPSEGLQKSGLRKATRIGLNRAASPVKAAVVSHAEAVKRFGYVGKAVRIRLRTYPADRFVAVIGPSTKYTRKKGKFSRGKKKGQARVFRPSKYAALVNSGTRHGRPTHWLDQARDQAGPGFVATAPGLVLQEIDNQLARRAT